MAFPLETHTLTSAVMARVSDLIPADFGVRGREWLMRWAVCNFLVIKLMYAQSKYSSVLIISASEVSASRFMFRTRS
jgi:hypothetical protein